MAQVTLKELLAKMESGQKVLVDNRESVGAVAETTVDGALFELMTTGTDLRVDHVSLRGGAFLLTVSGLPA